MPLPRRAPPLWFLILLAVVEAAVWQLAGGESLTGAPGGGHGPATHQAFLGFLLLVGSLIWKGLEIAGKVTLEVLRWMVINLSLVVTKIGNGLKVMGIDLLTGFRKAWDFLKVTYENVLKPAWEKFWRWFDKLRKWLDTTFGPILKWLRRLRDTLLDFWQRYVRPWLDLIDVTRRFLRVLNSLGLKWAGALDAKLGELEDKIERPFRSLLAKVNEIIDIVNRVITLDGMLQRITLLRSTARDMRFIVNQWWNTFHRAVDPAAFAALLTLDDKRTPRQEATDLKTLFHGQAGKRSNALDEHVLDLKLRLRRERP